MVWTICRLGFRLGLPGMMALVLGRAWWIARGWVIRARKARSDSSHVSALAGGEMSGSCDRASGVRAKRSRGVRYERVDRGLPGGRP